MNKSCHKRGSDTKQNLQKAEHVDLISLAKKNNQVQQIKTTKNKANRQIHIQTQKINQQANKRTSNFARHI